MSRWWQRLAPWARRDEDLDEEIRAHLALAVRDRVDEGETAREAERSARRELGNELLTREVTREMWGWGPWERLAQDLRYGLRLLRRNPGFTTAAVLTLALGVGANTTIFSIANALLFKPLPFHEPDRLAYLWEGRRDNPDLNILASLPRFRDWQESRSFERMAIFNPGTYNLSGDGEPELVGGLRVSAGFFETLGVEPLHGRTFLPSEEVFGASRLVMLSHDLWQRRYGADPALVGQTIQVDGLAQTVVGVMPATFQFQYYGPPRQLFVLAGFTENDRTDSHSFSPIARLAPDATFDSARAELDVIARRVSEEFPELAQNATVRVVPAAEWGVTGLRPTLHVLLALVAFVLLIACVNVANLFLARAAARHQEMGVRRALGAGRLRIARQLLTESLLLALLGGGAGLALAAWATSVLPGLLPPSVRFVPMRPLETIPLDLPVLLFTLGVSTLTGLVFGLAPALDAARSGRAESLTSPARGSTPGGAAARLRQVLVASEVALTLVVLAGAGLMMTSVRQLLAVDPGLDPKNVLVMGMSLPQENLYTGPPGLERFCADLNEQGGALPGVTSVGAIAHLPLRGANAGRVFTVEGQPPADPENPHVAGYTVACPGTLATLGIPVLQGRGFTDRDTPGAPGVVLVNQALAREYWPDQSAVGRRFKLGGGDSDAPWFTVVGVYRDVHHGGLDSRPSPMFMRPYQQAGWPFLSIVARTQSTPRAFAEPLEKVLDRITAGLPVSAFVQTMEEVVDASVGPRRFPMIALNVFALVALALAGVGVAGVVGYSVSQRTREIGVRMSLGARPLDVMRLVVEGSMTWALVGVLLGLAGCAAFLRLLDSLLFGVGTTDPWVLGIASTLLLGVAFVASWVPARQAARVDPVTALRAE